MFGARKKTAAAESPTATLSPSSPLTPATAAAATASFQVFLVEALKQILAAKEVPRKFPKIKEAAEIAQTAVQPSSAGTDLKPTAALADTILLPLELCCKTKNTALMVIALDCLGKLISYNFFGQVAESSANAAATSPATTSADSKTTPGSTANAAEEVPPPVPGKDERSSSMHALDRRPSGTLQGVVDSELDGQKDNTVSYIDRIVDIIYDSFTGDTTDDKVQLQIFRALHAAVSCNAPGSTIHESSLLKAIRTAYNIFLLSKKTSIQSVAQGTLRQMIDHIYSRIQLPPEFGGNFAKFMENPIVEVAELQQEKLNSVKEEEEESKPVESPAGIPPATVVSKESTAKVSGELIASDLVKEVLDKAIGGRVPVSVPLPQVTVNEETLAASSSTPSINLADLRTPKLDTHILDAFLVFRALVRLSIKPIPEGSSETKSFALKSKVLSLHLLNHIVQNHFAVVSSLYPIPARAQEADGKGASPQKSSVPAHFVDAVKSSLCYSLSRNAVSLVPEVLDRSLEIFLKLVLGMRHHLKKEIEVFFNEIFLGVLESRSNQAITYHQRLALLRSISKLCSDPQTLVEIYLNYDCDPQALDNTYERIVNILSKIMTSREYKLLQQGPPLPPGVDVGLDLNSAFAGSTTSTTSMATLTSNGAGKEGEPTGTRIFSDIVSIPAGQSVAGVPFGVKHLGTLSTDREQSIKFKALECIVSILTSMVIWSKSYVESIAPVSSVVAAASDEKEKALGGATLTPSPASEDFSELSVTQSVRSSMHEDFNRFEAAKQQKQVIREAVRLFNWKYKKGIQYLIDNRVIKKNAQEIARFLLTTPGLNKRNIGEYLGEGEDWNISVMHAFVDMMEFTNLPFVSALRMFLQSFRLPGEAQKIDRFMLKFAERFVRNNPGTFANADTGYVLAYSVIMLNTDQHNPQIKKRMTKAEFLKNNRGINDNANLPDEFLGAIFDEIAVNEIKMKDEHEAAAKADPSKANAEYDSMSSRQKKETFLQVSEEIATRSEAVFKGIASKNAERKGVDVLPFHVARHAEHIRLMFEVCWMPILAGISAPLQELDVDDMQTCQLVLTAFRCAIHLGCIFDADLIRNAFASTLTKYAYLNSVHDLIWKPKNVECIRAFLEVALADGNWLKETWSDVFRCISQVERFLSTRNDAEAAAGMPGLMPGMSTAADASRAGGANGKGRSGGDSEPAVHRPLTVLEEQQEQAAAQSLLVLMDRIFTTSNRLSGTAIVAFVKSLCQISLEDIQQSTSSTVLSTVPRMYSLTKLVEISYYNMARIRIEWSNLWLILGEHFNQVGCHANQHVGFFSVDSLRQLSMKFLEKEELSNFKFQKDFLRPFEHILSNNQSLVIKDMVVRCIQQMVQARAQNIRSGWKAIFAVLTKSSRESNEAVVSMAFDLVKHIQSERFNYVMVENNAFPDYMTCLVEFARNRAFPKINLQAVELVKASIPKILAVLEHVDTEISPLERRAGGTDSVDSLAMKMPPAVTKSATVDDPVLRFWFPIHFALYEIIMTCELEVRARALKHLFDTLKEHGKHYTPEFWDVVSRGVIFPIFDDLRLTRTEKRQFENKDDMTVWLNTTLIQALRQLVDLFTYSFDSLEGSMMDGVLELIKVCFSTQQENETLAKIGSSCLQQLIESNVSKFREQHWDKVTDTIVALFETTTAATLFEPDFVAEVMSRAEGSDGDGHSRMMSTESGRSADNLAAATSDAKSSKSDLKPKRRHLKRDFQQIILKCVLQLLVIQTTHDIIVSTNPANVQRYMRSKHLLRLLRCLEESYQLAKTFNADMPLRIALYKIGFMKQLPNLLKQETTSVLSILSILYQMFTDSSGAGMSAGKESTEQLAALPFDLAEDRNSVADAIGAQLKSIGESILTHFNSLEPAVKQRNIVTWMPVVIRILDGLLEMSDEKFQHYSPPLYRHIVEIVGNHDMTPELRASVHGILARTDDLWKISTTAKAAAASETHIAPPFSSSSPKPPPPPEEEGPSQE